MQTMVLVTLYISLLWRIVGIARNVNIVNVVLA